MEAQLEATQLKEKILTTDRQTLPSRLFALVFSSLAQGHHCRDVYLTVLLLMFIDFQSHSMCTVQLLLSNVAWKLG